MIEYRFLVHDDWGGIATVDLRYRVIGIDGEEFEGIDEQLMAQFEGLA